jgi:exosortase A
MEEAFSIRGYSVRPSWIKAAVLFGIWFGIFWPVYPEMVQTWLNSSNNSHGILVPLISAFFIWNKREELSRAEVGSSSWGLVILAMSMVLYLLAFTGQVAVVARLMIVTSLIGLVLFNYGREVFGLLKFPLIYLVFMIPIPVTIYNLIAFPLQLFATKVSHFLISLVQIPVYREGNMLYFVQTQLEVADACSGIRSMMAFVMLSVLFAYLMDRGWGKRILLVALAIPLAIFANIVRVTGTGILAHFYGKKVARGFMHEFSGMAVFAFGFVLLFLLYWLLNKWSSRRE